MIRRVTDKLNGDRGFATTQALVLAAMLSLVAFALLRQFQTSSRDAAQRQSSVIALTAAEVGLERCTVAVVRVGDPLRSALVPDGRQVALATGDVRTMIALESETSKLSLRGGSPILLERLSAVVDERASDADAVKRILSDVQRADGPSLRVSAAARSSGTIAPLDRLFTTYSTSSGVDPWYANVEVLRALPGVSTAAAAAFAMGRDTVRGTSEEDAFPVTILGPLAAEHFSRQGGVFTCRAVAEHGAVRSVVALARVILVRGSETGNPEVEVLDEYRDSDWRVP